MMTSLNLGLHWLDRLEDAMRLPDAAVATAQRRGSSADIAMAPQFRADSHRRAGRLRDAESDARIAVAAAGESGWAGGGGGAIIPLVGALVDQGRLDEAERALVGAFPDGREIPDHPHMNFLLVERMRLRSAQGLREEALADWEESVRRAERYWGMESVVWVGPMCAAADLHAARGEHETAMALAEQAVDHATRFGGPGFVGTALA